MSNEEVGLEEALTAGQQVFSSVLAIALARGIESRIYII